VPPAIPVEQRHPEKARERLKAQLLNAMAAAFGTLREELKPISELLNR
jgi:hypothetical protein